MSVSEIDRAKSPASPPRRRSRPRAVPLQEQLCEICRGASGRPDLAAALPWNYLPPEKAGFRGDAPPEGGAPLVETQSRAQCLLHQAPRSPGGETPGGRSKNRMEAADGCNEEGRAQPAC